MKPEPSNDQGALLLATCENCGHEFEPDPLVALHCPRCDSQRIYDRTERKRVELDDQSDIPPIVKPELVPIERARPPFSLWAMIKKSSKYYHQGLTDPTNGKSKPRVFQITSIIIEQCDGYDFRMNGNQYRREDLVLYIKAGEKLKKI